MLLLPLLIIIIFFIGMFVSALITFYWNNDCFEDFADEFCESIGQTENDIWGSSWSGSFDCTINERLRTSGIEYYFTEQEMEECLK